MRASNEDHRSAIVIDKDNSLEEKQQQQNHYKRMYEDKELELVSYPSSSYQTINHGMELM